MNQARIVAKPYILRINKSVEMFIAFVLARIAAEQQQAAASVWDLMPQGFDISSEGWRTMEEKIEDSIAEGDIALAESLCKQYEERATKYLDGWREKLK